MKFNAWGDSITKIVIISILLIALGVLFVIPIPYFVIQPGSAMDVSPFVRVGNIPADSRGDFLLTTISLKEGSGFDYLFAQVSDDVELVPEHEILAGSESEEEYQKRQVENMTMSQNQALVAAYRYAKKPVIVRMEGIEVFGLIVKRSGLRDGDLIQKVDGRRVQSVESLIQYLNTKKKGEQVEVELIRDRKRLTVSIPLVALPAEPGEKPRVGLGITPVARVKVTTNPPAQIRADEIGGPSAGLMFSLEVLDRLLKEPLARGYRIAGTGTISETGEVGQIGGIQHKIVAAEREGAEIFFCPRDLLPHDTNEKVAKETAKRMGTEMKIVPVSSLKEAVEVLRKLPPKE